METPLLATKLYRPNPQLALVQRRALLARLQQGVGGKLTLVLAPAGFGKSTLVSQWVREVAKPVAWLTLDEYDNEPTRFLAYVIAALQQIEPSCGAQTLALLGSPHPPLLETLLTTLINEMALIPQAFLLVWDDYQLIEAAAVHELVNFLLTYLPAQAHLVIVSRREPPLALARLRARGELTELQTTDLRFSPAEVVEFFVQSVGVHVPAEVVTALDDRTEGWAAGLRLAAVILQSINPTERAERFTNLLANFHGDDRHVSDYLTEEVFDRLAPERQSFLVQTALLQRLCGPLCEAVTGSRDSQALLEELAREHLFLLPLDNQRHWYRYHPLFADFLRRRLQALAPDQLLDLHRRAANWYVTQGLVAPAIDHALAAHDFEQAARLIEGNALRLALSSEVGTLARWLQLLPAKLSQTRPLLAFAQAGIALLGSRFVEAKQWIETAERTLAALPTTTELPLAPQTLQGHLDALRCTVMVNLRAPVTEIITVAQRALLNLPTNETFLRGAVALNLGDAYARQNANTLAAAAFAEAAVLTQQASNLTVQLAALGSQGELFARQGQLAEAAEIYQRAIAAGLAWGKTTGQTHPATGKVHAFYANVLYEWNHLDEAERQALAAVDCCQRWGHTAHLVDSHLALINILWAQGKQVQVEATLTAARLAASEGWSSTQEQGAPSVAARELVVAVERAQLQLWLRQGRWPDIAHWLADHAADEHLAVCLAQTRLALVQHELARAAGWLAKTEQQLTQRMNRLGELKVRLLQAQLHQHQGQSAEALATLSAALALAEPGGYVRALVDEGSVVAELLVRLVQQTGLTDYTRRLLTAFGVAEHTPAPTPPILRPPAILIEPLSEREREVLRLIAADLTYEAIGARLVISLNTVRTHAKHIYSKLNVNRRNQAVARAQELGLL